MLRFSFLARRGKAASIVVALGLLALPAMAADVNPKNWSTGTAIEGGEMAAPTGTVVVMVGASVSCAVSEATDKDHWEKKRTTDDVVVEDDDEDDTINYLWNDGGGAHHGTFANVGSNSTTWTAPSEPGTYTLTCTIDDAPGPITPPETGSRDDDSLNPHVTVVVIRKEWTVSNNISGGRMTAPQNQTGTTNDPASVKVRIGKTLSCAVEDATDTDHWEIDLNGDGQISTNPTDQEQGDEPDTVYEKWECSGGEFVVVNSNGTTTSLGTTLSSRDANFGQWHGAWKAPTSLGPCTIKCTLNDAPATVTAPDHGSRDDENDTVVRQVTVTVYKLSVSFIDTVVAAGHVDNEAHHAKFEITATDGTNVVRDVAAEEPQVTDGGLGPYNDNDVTADPHLTQATTGADGKAYGYLLSGHRTQPTQIWLDGSTSSTTQVWNGAAEASWNYNGFYFYNEPTPIVYTMSYQRNNAWVTIGGHSTQYKPTAISGYEWLDNYGEDADGDGVLDGDYIPINYSEDDALVSGWERWGELPEFAPVSEIFDGSYATNLTVPLVDEFLIDGVDFEFKDLSVFEAQ